MTAMIGLLIAILISINGSERKDAAFGEYPSESAGSRRREELINNYSRTELRIDVHDDVITEVPISCSKHPQTTD